MPLRTLLYLWIGLAAGAQAASMVKSQDLKLPLEFETNRGQFAPEVLFLARTASHFVYLTPAGMTLGLSGSTQRGAALQMQLVHANASSRVVPESRLAGVSNYFIGNDPSGWQRQVPHYGRIRYRAVWPGIDMVFYGNDQALEYDFAISPGADPSAIRLAYVNAGELSIDADGSLTIETASGKLVQRRPQIYQESAGIRRAVRGGFRIAGKHEVRFELGAYDRRMPLVIDPTVTYSTYIGGTGTVSVKKVAVDGTGNLYVTGSVASPDFPVVNPVRQVSSGVGLFGSSDQGATWGKANSAFGTAKVSSLAADPGNPAVAYAGTSSGVFKTTDGGNSWKPASSGLPNDSITSVAVDPLATSTLYGCTPEGLYKSTDAAATWKLLPNGGACVAVATDAKAAGTIWLTYTFGIPVVSFDGGNTLFNVNLPKILGTTVAVDPTNSSNVFCGTVSGGLLVSVNRGLSFTQVITGLSATTGSAVTINAIAIDKQNPTRVLVGTNTGVYFSGSGGLSFQSTKGIGNRKVLSLIIDPKSDAIVIAGTAGGGVYTSQDGGQNWTATGPSNLDVNAVAMSADEQATWAGLYSGNNAFVTKINPAGTSILFSSYLGGSGQSDGSGIAVDSSGHTFVCGSTDAFDFPTQNPYQRYAGGSDMFVARLSASGSLDASTFLGGRADDSCYALALDPGGNVYLSGTTILITGGRSDFPTTPGVLGQQSFGGQDCVVAKFDNALQKLVYSTFLGGGAADSCYGIAADSPGNAYVVGDTYSTDFAVTQPPFGGSRTSGSPANSPGFVSKIKPDGSALIYSALLGGTTGPTQLNGVAVSSAGRAYVTGYTAASDYPVTDNVLSKTLSASNKTVLTAIEADGSKLFYSTFFPGLKPDYGLSLSLDSNGNAWVTGTASDGGFPVTSDALPHSAAASVFTPWIAEVDTVGANLLYATYLGGNAGGQAADVAVGPDGSIYAAGTTRSTDFTQTGTPFKQAQKADYALYLMRLVFSSSSSGGTDGPTITSVQNGASFQNGFVPGAWMTVKGTNLALVPDTWDRAIVNNQLPTKLDGVSVSIGGQGAYVYFVSPEQINVVVPNVPPGPVNVVVTTDKGTSAPFPATAQTYQPAFFLWNNTYAVATRQDFSYAAKQGTFAGLATVPAKPGDVIILWGTGFGPSNPAAPAGVPVPVSSFPTANPVTVSVGNQSATVFGAALAPGFAALYQVAIQIPASLADGDYPVVATVAGQSSPATAIITVQH